MNLYELSEIADTYLQKGERVPNRLVEEISKYIDGESFGLGQINPIAGNIEYNAKKIANYIKYAENIGLKMIIFPELSLMGYPIEDVIYRHPVIVRENIKWLTGLAELTKNTAAIVGFVEPNNSK